MPLRLVTLTGDPEKEASLATELSALEDVELVFRCVDRVEVLAAVRSEKLDAIVSIGAPGWLDRQTAQEAAASGIRLVGLADNALEDERLESLGAKVLDATVSSEDIIDACRASSEAAIPSGGDSPQEVKGGKVIAIWGPKGSPGRTSIAIELAAELAAGGAETILVDGDSYGGDVLQLLGFIEELPTVLWGAAAAAKGKLDKEELLGGVRKASTNGPILLPGLPRSDLWDEVSDFGWRELLRLCRASFAFTVCDVGSCIEPDSYSYGPPGGGRNRMTRSALTSADHVLAVCRADPIGLKNFIWSFGELQALVEPQALSIVLNRSRPSDRRDASDILHRHLGRRPIARIPDKPQDFARAVADGSALIETCPKSEVRAAIRDVAAMVGGSVETVGFLSRLAGVKSV
jgi:MinD-like ATPase involved in chromosome partitioning or flagellar assembly